jgi:hypothetical protein
MPLAYAIDSARCLVLSRAWGVLTDYDLLAHARAVAADPRFAPHFNQLGDLREVTEFQVSSATIWQAVRLNPFGAGARRAAVVGSDLVYAMARMYQMMRVHSLDEMEVFRELDQALHWLGLAEASTELLAALSNASPIRA